MELKQENKKEITLCNQGQPYIQPRTMRYFRRVTSIDSLSIQRKRHQSLSQMFLSIREKYSPSATSLPKFQKSDFKCLRDLTITIPEYANAQDLRMLRRVSLLPNCLKNLKKLYLYSLDCENLSNMMFRGLVTQFGNMKQLTQFDLKLHKNYLSDSNKEIATFRSLIGKKWKKLEEFSLVIPEGVTDESCRVLATRLRNNFRQLQRLKLSFQRCNLLSEGEIKNLMTQIGDGFKQLEQLDLDFSQCTGITDDAVSVLTSGIGNNLAQLQQLKLNFYQCKKITDSGVYVLGHYLGKDLKSLDDLALDFSECSDLTDEGIVFLAIQLGNNFKHLRNLKLGFQKLNGLTRKGIIALATQIGNNWSQLRQLSLNFFTSESLDDEGITALATQIGTNLSSLRKLDLNFGFSFDISDEGLLAFFFQLPRNLHQLEELSLDFSW